MEIKNILLIVGVAIYYYLRAKSNNKQAAKKKSVKPQPSGNKPANENKSLEDILREFQKELTPEPIHSPIEPITEREPIVEEPIHRQVKPTTPEILRVEVEEEEMDEEDIFDLRQAVINDAILNRPHRF